MATPKAKKAPLKMIAAYEIQAKCSPWDPNPINLGVYYGATLDKILIQAANKLLTVVAPETYVLYAKKLTIKAIPHNSQKLPTQFPIKIHLPNTLTALDAAKLLPKAAEVTLIPAVNEFCTFHVMDSKDHQRKQRERAKQAAAKLTKEELDLLKQSWAQEAKFLQQNQTVSVTAPAAPPAVHVEPETPAVPTAPTAPETPAPAPHEAITTFFA